MLLALIVWAVLGIGFLTIAACFGTVILTVMGAGILVSDFWDRNNTNGGINDGYE